MIAQLCFERLKRCGAGDDSACALMRDGTQ